MIATLHTPREFSFKECLGYLGRSSKESLHLIENDKIYKLLKIKEDLSLLEIGYDETNILNVNFLNYCPRKQVCQSALEFVKEWFDLETDLTPFYEMAKKDKLLKELVKRYYGLRLIGIPDLFEAVTWAVIGQQINLEFAYKLKKRFVESFGEKIEYDNKTFRLFPAPEEIVNLSVAELTELQFTGKKAEYIIEFAYNLVIGNISKEELLRLDFEGAKKELISFRGIGEWTANYVIMRCLRNYNALPLDDVGLQNAIKKVLNLPEKPTMEKMLSLSGGWNKWSSYATFYLWRVL